MVENLLTWFRSQITSADMVTQDLQLAAVAEQTVAASGPGRGQKHSDCYGYSRGFMG